MSVIFYDTETTGLETFFDQILQFAAIRTDADLDEIERFEIRCRLLPHIVPTPGALNLTRVKVSQLTDPSFPSHYEMVRAVRAKLLSWSPALFVGWNSIRFDEDMLRQALYKTLHNPYLTNSAGNSRSDLMRIVQACSLFAPDAIQLPIGSDGKQVFELDEVAPMNGFQHRRAHDAMADVEASIYLSRLVMEKAPNVWSSFMRFSKKAAVVDFIGEQRMFCMTNFYHGKSYSCIVMTIGQNQENKAEWYVYNLGIDPEPLKSLSSEDLAARLAEFPKPIRRLKSNAAPILFSTEDALEAGLGQDFTLDELENRAEIIQADSELRRRLIAAHESLAQHYPPSIYVEMQIYDGFFQQPDESLMNQFHDSPWEKRDALVMRFQDPRLRAIGRHLLHIERPDLLDSAICKKLDLEVSARLLGHGEDVVWMTLPKALMELENMLKAASGADLTFLREHQQFLRDRHTKVLGL